MVLSRASGSLEHRHFIEIVDFLHAGDVLVLNDSRVMPARLYGHRVGSGGKVEILLLRRLDAGLWEALLRPGRLGKGAKIEINGLLAEVLERGEAGMGVVRFSDETLLEEMGQVPLPPYIHVPLGQPERYQTVYARRKGSAAAPTAGLHFTPELLHALQEKGILLTFVTLHVGLDSFRPVQVDDPRHHPIHKEYCELSPEAVQRLSQAKAEGRRIICVGTTTVRVVEEAFNRGFPLKPFNDWTGLFILPGYHFRMADALITNFHLPRSTLLMLVSAFAGKELIHRAYREAIELHYRFYSFGDAMLIL
jgi:S-adenosylmethionine:tRNA ribosyltransferase-isomerase